MRQILIIHEIEDNDFIEQKLFDRSQSESFRDFIVISPEIKEQLMRIKAALRKINELK